MEDRQASRLGCDSGLHLHCNVEASACEAGAAAKLAATRKIAKYSDLSDKRIYKFSVLDYTFYLVAVEMLGPFNEMAHELIGNLGKRIARLSGDNHESSFLFQRLSVVVQHFNSILLHNSFFGC